MNARRMAVVALVLLTGGVVMWLLRGEFARAFSSAPADALTPEERVVMLENSLRALEDGVRDAPRDRWDPAYVVERIGQNADSLYGWVQENTTWIPYRGSLRGPVGVLMDRQGNSLDRALLLADLLQRAGHSVRLARTVLPLERARAMLPEQAATRPSEVGGDFDVAAGPPASIPEVAEGYGLNGETIEETLQSYDEATADLLSRVEERVASQAARLLSTVDGLNPAAEWMVRADSAVAMLRDHWWVQHETGGFWRDFDLVRSDGASFAPIAEPVEIVAPTDVDSSLHHRVTIRVVTERFTEGRLVTERVLEHALRPSDLIGRAIMLQFWPTAWQPRDSTSGSARSLRMFALEQDQWRASLLIGNEAVAEALVDVSTRSSDRATGSLGGLGGAMNRALDTRRAEEDSLLTATSIEYLIEVPGRAPRVLRRTVFDLIGPAARQAGVAQSAPTFDERQVLERSLSLMMRTEILPLVAQPNAEYVADLAARNMLANANLLRAVSQPGFGSQAHKLDSLVNNAQPGVSPLYALAVLRHHAIGTAAFLDQPAIFTRHRYPLADGDSVVLADATDVVANELGISLSEWDGFAARVVQGVWDTNLEALLGLAGGPVGNAAAAFEATRAWLILTRADKSRLRELRLPEDAVSRIASELDNGFTVVASKEPVMVDRHEFTAWWRIQPETGDALGIGENGWGQGSEYSLTTNIMIVGGRAFVFEYGLCQFIPQMANSLRVIGGEFWRLGIAPSWTRPPEPGKDFEDVAVENNRVCLKQAMLAGFLATAPLLISTARYKILAAVQRRAVSRGAVANLRQSMFCLCLRGTMPSISRAPGTSPRPQGTPAPKGGPTGNRGPRGTLPGGARDLDPLGKTEPGLPKVPTGQATPGLNSPDPYTRAAAAERAAYRKSAEATGDWIRYRYNMPGEEFDPRWRGDPSKWDASADEILRQRMVASRQEWYKAMDEVEAVKDAARKARGLPPPQLPPARPQAPAQVGCPPNCKGNENPTGVAGQPALGSQSSGGQAPIAAPPGALEVGSVGAAQAFWQITWPFGFLK